MQNILSSAYDEDMEEILVQEFDIGITRKDILRLRGFDPLRPLANWLNDNLVNFYVELICERAKAGSRSFKKAFAFNSFFYSGLIDPIKSQSVKKWFKDVNIFDFDIILVPINIRNVHWALTVSV